MKKPPQSIRIPVVAGSGPDRRAFCRALAGGTATVALGACQGEPGRSLDMERPPIDFAKLPSSDLATVPDFAAGPPRDLAERCITPDFDTFATPASYLIDTATLIPAVHIYVCRDAGGLYAMTSICTHSGCEVTKNAMRFQCGCHGSRFSLNGAVIMGPARLPLVHHGMLLSAAGTVIVQPCTFVKDTDRYNL